jgi:hypothetical protein
LRYPRYPTFLLFIITLLKEEDAVKLKLNLKPKSKPKIINIKTEEPIRLEKIEVEVEDQSQVEDIEKIESKNPKCTFQFSTHK